MHARIEEFLMSEDTSTPLKESVIIYFTMPTNAANPGQTNQHTQGIVRAESGYYCRDPLRFSLWDSIGSTLILIH